MLVSKIARSILTDMDRTIDELCEKGIVRDIRGISTKETGKGSYIISFSGKNDSGSIVFDKHITATEIIDVLLRELQYTILLYDKSIIQAEYEITDNIITKERLVFMKRHNKIWDPKEIQEFEVVDEDWFAEENGIPIILRIDYAPKDHVDGKHAATHLTLSNHESCRIPIKGIVTFSEFVRFILNHFYNIELKKETYRFEEDDTITDLEKKMIHINWV